jgi:hypothetical protein
MKPDVAGRIYEVSCLIIYLLRCNLLRHVASLQPLDDLLVTQDPSIYDVFAHMRAIRVNDVMNCWLSQFDVLVAKTNKSLSWGKIYCHAFFYDGIH